MYPNQDPIPELPGFNAQARQRILELDLETGEAIRKHVQTIDNLGVMLFVSFSVPIVSIGLSIYYFVRRAAYDDLSQRAPLPEIAHAFEVASREDLMAMKRASQRVRDLGRFFDARATYKWLILGNLGITAFWVICFCAGIGAAILAR